MSESTANADIQTQFIQEALADLQRIQQTLPLWKNEGSALPKSKLAEVERWVNTIMGGAGFFQMLAVTRLTKPFSRALHLLHQQRLEATPPLLDLMEATCMTLNILIKAGSQGQESAVAGLLTRWQTQLPQPANEQTPEVQKIQPQAGGIPNPGTEFKLSALSTEFIQEAILQLRGVRDETLLKADASPVGRLSLQDMYQKVHTIHGNAGFFALPSISQFSQGILEVLNALLKQQLEPTEAALHLLLDAKYRLLDLFEAIDHEDEVEVQDILTQLQNLKEGQKALPEKSLPSSAQKPEALAHIRAESPTFEVQSPAMPTPSPSKSPTFEVQSPAMPTPSPSKEKTSFPLGEVLKEFTIEAMEHAETLEEKLLALESSPGNASAEVIDTLFRAAHSIKGGAGFLGMIKISKVAHVMENVLDELRSGEAHPTPDIISHLLAGVDLLRHLLRHLPNDEAVDVTPFLEGKAIFQNVTATEAPPSSPIATPKPEFERPTAISEPTGTLASTAPKPENVSHAGESIRVSTALLNRLMALAGELVLIRNQQLQLMEQFKSEALNTITQRLNLVTSELQESIMRTRMQPVNSLFSKFPRVIRDLSRKLGKKVELQLEGQDVEIDRTILESLSAPLTHLLRNSVDHGIELPQERRNSGKPETGTVILRASHEEGMVLIEVRDDGRGILRERLRLKAIEKGILNEAQLEKLPDRELLNLIFHPGFSTAEKITDVSGRGVGMDVVRQNIESLGGFVHLTSQERKGTTIEIRLPLTLAIMPSLIVMNRGERFAIPQTELVEVVCLYDDEVYLKLETIQDVEVCRLRGELLPLVRLTEVLKSSMPLNSEQRRTIAESFRSQQTLFRTQQSLENRERPEKIQQELMIVVLRSGISQFGLVVDNVLDTEEIVVKPLHSRLKQCRCFAGATIMGDGQVALILDVAGLAQHSGVQFQKMLRDEAGELRLREEDQQTLLLFRYGDTEQFAVPLPLISRVEEIVLSELQLVGGRELIAINDVLYRVLRLDSKLNVSGFLPESETGFLIVSKQASRPCGILARSLIDITALPSDLHLEECPEPGTLGTFIWQQRLTIFLDFFSLLELIDPEWFQLKKTWVKSRRLLLIESSPMMQTVVAGYLKRDSHQVTILERLEEATRYLESHRSCEAVLMGLDSLAGDGLAFVRELRHDPAWRNLPIIALTQQGASAELLLKAGVSAVLNKINRTELSQCVNTLLPADSTK